MEPIIVMNYVDAISTFHPEVGVVCHGDPNTYENIIWEQGAALPSKETLDLIILDKTRTDQLSALSDACQVQIRSGFESAALGIPGIYDSEEVDQLNLIGAVSTISPSPLSPTGYSTPYVVRQIINGETQPKAYLIHDYAQLRQVMTDGVQFKLACLIKFNAKRNHIVNNCQSIQDILNVTWDSVES